MKPISIPTVSNWLNKVLEVTLAFWVIKIMSTTVGETGADFLAVNAGMGQGMTRAVMGALLAAALFLQLRMQRYTPWAYWLTVVLVSVVGTLITDLLTDGLGVSLYVSTAVFAAILCTFALGTAAGDLATEALGLGFIWGAVVFGALIAITYAAYRLRANGVLTFWIGYILTRPFGASLGDFLTQAKTYCGLGMGAMGTTALSLTVIVLFVAVAQLGTDSRRSTSTAL